MDIEYSYEITKVDYKARVMEVVYSNPDFGTQHVSARLPYKGESIEDVIEMFSPVADWRERTLKVQEVSKGLKGFKISEDPTTLPLENDTSLYDALLDTLPAIPKESIKVIESMSLNNLRVRPVHNRMANLVGIELFGPESQASVREGSNMFNSTARVVSKASLIGVTILARSEIPNVVDFLVKTLGFTSQEDNGAHIMHTPKTAVTGRKFIYSSQVFLDKFTQQELADVLALTTTDGQAKVFYDRLLAADFIDITDPRTAMGLDLLISKGALTAARKSELLTPE